MPRAKLPEQVCIVCKTKFMPTRHWQCFCTPVCRSQARLEKQTAEYACHYCGVLADTIDHVPPRSVRQTLVDLGLAPKYPFVEVRCCRECNCALGAKPLWTLAQRKRFINEWLRRRYQKYLKMPDWTIDELAEMGPRLREEVEHGIAVRDFTVRRLEWRSFERDAMRKPA